MSHPRGRPPQFLRRVHNRPAMRRRGSLAVLLRLLLVAAGLGIGGGGAWMAWTQVVESPVFHLRGLDLQEVPAHLRGPVEATLDPARGHNLVMLDLDRLRVWVERIPQVHTASLRRQLPETLAVKVTERRPWGTLRTDDGLWLVDREGVVLKRLGRPEPGLPRVHLPGRLGPLLEPRSRVPGEMSGAAMLPEAVDIVEWLRREEPAAFPPLAELRLEPGAVVLVPHGADWELVLGRAERL
ncbi:MAG: cell division protein FtsQ/DivIB, partial [Acidobacteriota bacterium]